MLCVIRDKREILQGNLLNQAEIRLYLPCLHAFGTGEIEQICTGNLLNQAEIRMHLPFKKIEEIYFLNPIKSKRNQIVYTILCLSA